MANPKHLKILKQGVETWNRWRKDHRGVVPDLVAADLRGAHLRGCDLSEANISHARFEAAKPDDPRADLSGAILLGAHVCEANLRMADLSGADLSGADFHNSQLSIVDLSHVNLTAADLSQTILIATDFHRANFEGVNLNYSMIGHARLTEVDLSKAKGLETVRHSYPSTIGIDTIYKSKGNIPEIFLRGAGVPEDFIVYMRSLVGKAIEFYSCFISHSSKDSDFAHRLHADLQQKGVRCWFAPEDLKIGDKFRMRIDESIRVYDKLMVILSANSINSPWVEEEVEAAIEKEHQQNKPVLFPIRLDDVVMETEQAWAASLRRTRHIGDFRAWKDHDPYQKAFDRLLRDLKA
jgi:hypothetical protein